MESEPESADRTEDPTERPGDLDSVGMDPGTDSSTEKVRSEVGSSAVDETVPRSDDPTSVGTRPPQTSEEISNPDEAISEQVRDAVSDSRSSAEEAGKAENPDPVEPPKPDPSMFSGEERERMTQIRKENDPDF
jgi:hypothetical protein